MQIVDVVIRTEQTACGLSFTWCCAVALIEMSVGRGDSVFSIKTQDSLACCVEDFFFFFYPSQQHVLLVADNVAVVFGHQASIMLPPAGYRVLAAEKFIIESRTIKKSSICQQWI